MPLDPKQIEALSGLARAAAAWRKGCSNTEEGKPEGCGECTAAFLAAAKPHLLAAPEAVPALLSEREEMLARLRDLRDGIGAAMGAVMEGDVYSVAVHLRRLADDDRLAAFLR
jgi:hypothetical protein